MSNLRKLVRQSIEMQGVKGQVQGMLLGPGQYKGGNLMGTDGLDVTCRRGVAAELK